MLWGKPTSLQYTGIQTWVVLLDLCEENRNKNDSELCDFIQLHRCSFDEELCTEIHTKNVSKKGQSFLVNNSPELAGVSVEIAAQMANTA